MVAPIEDKTKFNTKFMRHLFLTLFLVATTLFSAKAQQPLSKQNKKQLTLSDLNGRIKSHYIYAINLYKIDTRKFKQKYKRELEGFVFEGSKDVYEVAKLYVVNSAIEQGRFKFIK